MGRDSGRGIVALFILMGEGLGGLGSGTSSSYTRDYMMAQGLKENKLFVHSVQCLEYFQLLDNFRC